MLKELFPPSQPRLPIIGWALYDFADTAFSALFITFFFPIWIRSWLGGTEFQIGLALGLSLLAAALIVPLIGAIADARGRRLPILMISTFSTVGIIALTGYAGLAAALVLGFLANLVKTISVDLYDAFIPELAPPPARGRLSGFGTAVGYLGTIAALAAAYVVLSFFGFESRAGVQAIFPTIAIFFFVFSLPMFFWVRDRAVPQRPPLRQAVGKATSELRSTFTQIVRGQGLPGLGPFLLASFIYNDAMHTTIIFLSLFATLQVGLTIQQFFGAFAIMALAAFVGSLLFGWLSDRLRPRRVLSLILVGWIVVVASLLWVSNWQTFLMAGSVGGALLGGVWTCNRHMITLISPPHKIAELFGYEGLTEKVAGVIGPIGFGFLATNFGYPPALIFLLVLFALGLFVLRRYVPASL